MTATEYIPVENWDLWYGLFKRSRGWFVSRPFAGKDDVLVHYAFDDIDSANELNANYLRLTTSIVETRRGFWKKFKRKLRIKR